MSLPKVLIIKTGYSETFHPEVGDVTSLGDVFMTTVILHPFKDHHVTWLVDKIGVPLLEGISYIDRILSYDVTSVLQLQSEKFNIVVNLEKVPGICALADSINARVKYGYYFDMWLGQARSRGRSLNSYLSLDAKKEAGNRFWPEVLFDAIGRKWNGEKCVLDYVPESTIEFDVGFNCAIGLKWPNKAWPAIDFISLELKLRELGYGTSWQKGQDSIREYLDWIGKCRLLVTNDSLGLHLAIAMGKKVVVIVGPTDLDGRYVEGSVVRPEEYACAPCWKSECGEKVSCMESVGIEKVLREVRKWSV